MWRNLCITHWAEHLKKGQAYSPDANHEAFLSLNQQGCKLSQAKQGLPRNTEGKCRDNPKPDSNFTGKSSSPTDSRFL